MSKRFFHYRTQYAAFLLSVALGCSPIGWSQQQQQQQRLSYTPSTLVDQANSRAEQEAEQMVSLSADKILSILRDESGLLLQVKKAIVRNAFEQGRVLNAEDLTDEALFRLIREDDNVRVIATREIEDRQYIRAKPTREELARNLPCRQPMTVGALAPAKQPDPSLQGQSKDQNGDTQLPTKEEVYWTKHDDDLDCYLTQYLPYGPAQPYGQTPYAQMPAGQQNPSSLLPSQPYQQNPQQQYPQQQYPQQQSPQQQYPQSQPGMQTPSLDYRRQLEFTQMRRSQGYFGMDSDESEMAGVQASDLPSLLSASQTGGFSSTGKGSMGDSGTGVSGLSLPSSMTSSMGSSTGSLGSLGSLFQGQSSSSGLPEEANLEQQLPPQLPPYFPSSPQRPRYRHQPNPYADIPSLYDLYTQYSRQLPVLERFGQEIFRNGTGNLGDLPMDVPAGPEYVVGPGDGLTINLTGGVSQRLQRVVDREGRVVLPEVGAIEVSGRNLGDVQHMVQTILRSQFRDVDADVALTRVRTVRVYVVGDVERPGPYDVSSLSTPLNAVFAAGGPTSAGSVRTIQHYRGKQLIQDVDVYDLLLHGIRSDLKGLQPGDTIRVPPLKAGVTIAGMVRRPAIYELRGETTLADALELAGGVLPTGTLRHVDVERVEDHQSRIMLRLDIPETNNQAQTTQALEDFKIQDGDKIRITPILPYADKTVYLDGYVSRPGKFAYRDGMKVTDLIGSYKDLLPEPSTMHAEIIRLNQPDNTPTVLAFNLGDALAGKDQDLVLKPFDTVRVFSKYDFEDMPVITVTGEVRDPGDHMTNGAPRLRDAVYLAGGTTPDALLEDAQVFRKTRDGKLMVISVNLANALEGDAKDNILLEAKDRVFIHRDLNKMDPAMVTIAGEVGRPGKYPLSENLTAAGLVRVAGGLKRGAYTEQADLTRYEVAQGTKIVSDHVEVPIAQAMAGEADADLRLRDGDVLTIRQLTGWKDLGATIQVTGEVVHPGTYGIQAGEKLSSIIERAGGFSAQAYAYGTVFEREQIRQLEEKNRSDLIDRVRSQSADVTTLPVQNAQDQPAKDAAIQQFQITLRKLENSPPQGRLVLHISSDLHHWANTSADIQVRAGDTMYVPKRPSVVLVDGSVFNPTGVTYKPGKSAGWYLKQSGGPTQMANKRGTFVIRADGSVVGGPSGLFSGGVESAEMRPGDMVVVPEKVITVSRAWQNTVQTAQILSAVAIAISAARNF